MESCRLLVSVSLCSGTSSGCPVVGSGRDRFTTGAIALQKLVSVDLIILILLHNVLQAGGGEIFCPSRLVLGPT
jgi:hypothetical protein